TDSDGDGFFDVSPCIPGETIACNRDQSICPPNQLCQCTASCPDCEDCGPSVCSNPGPRPYRCGADGGCQPGDHCTCASSCLGCDNCEVFVCVPDATNC